MGLKTRVWTTPYDAQYVIQPLRKKRSFIVMQRVKREQHARSSSNHEPVDFITLGKVS
mgnify:CR=1